VRTFISLIPDVIELKIEQQGWWKSIHSSRYHIHTWIYPCGCSAQVRVLSLVKVMFEVCLNLVVSYVTQNQHLFPSQKPLKATIHPQQPRRSKRFPLWEWIRWDVDNSGNPAWVIDVVLWKLQSMLQGDDFMIFPCNPKVNNYQASSCTDDSNCDWRWLSLM
jgi:hypothetical protein